ncbi:desiccation-related protein At2g46140-like [Rutidosis leptorrhynchoides]|uniref:desiccation-related protein At2g46140-like n=1 Tax=Rutidosis leptorrhynchoides TaxID=125765 RepID=UPI003A9908FD
MSSSDKPKAEEKCTKETEDGGFFGKVKGFINDIGDKIEDKVKFGKPSADLAAIHISKISFKQVDLIVDVLVTNPNPVPIPLVDINYLIENNGRKLASGMIPDAGTIHARSSETVKIPVTLVYYDLKKAYADIVPGTILPYKVKVDLIVDVPVIGKLTLLIEKCGEIPVPYRPDVRIEKIEFEKFSFKETVTILHLKLDNKNEFDLGLNQLEYMIWLGDVSIGGAKLAKNVTIVKNDVSELDIPFNFRPKDCGSAIWDMIRGKGTGYSIKGNIDVDTPYGNMKLPIEKVGGTTTFKNSKDDREDDNNPKVHLSRF